MYLPPPLMLAGAASTAFLAIVAAHEESLGNVMRRQLDASSVCSTSGVDYQDGGDYFINTNSNQAFLIVSTFQGCINNTADVSLVNESTGDQYDCGQVLTVPNGVSQTATCPTLKSQFTSGTYLIITVGNNGNGEPFAYQRQITIRTGTQQTITRYSTATLTITPTITVNYYIQQTTTISNCMTLTAPPVTRVTTKTPCDQTLALNETITTLVENSTTIDFTSTTTVTPTCRVSDRVCTLSAPTDKAMSIHRRILIYAPADKPSTRKRAPDTSANMVFATAANATTVTVTASPTAQRNIVTGTVLVPITGSPQTVPGVEVVKTIMAPGSTVTVHRDVYTTMYVTKTFTRATSTTTAIYVPPALTLECLENGGVLEL